MLKYVLISFVLVSLILSSHVVYSVSSPLVQANPVQQQITMSNTTHGNSLGGKLQVTPLGNNCYFPILVNDTITYTGNTTYTVSLQAFVMQVISFSSTITNQTNYVTIQPNNLISSFIMLKAPNNVVLLEITFAKTCIFGSIQTVTLTYNDGASTATLI